MSSRSEDLSPVGCCTALNKVGSICGLPSCSNNKWCDYHSKRMIKYYKTYKSLESTIPSIDKIGGYDKENLIKLNQKLIKIYHYRTTLRQQGYPDYQDEGHQIRIDNILKMIETVSSKISSFKSNMVFDGDLSDFKTRIARATSTRRVKSKARQQRGGPKILTDVESFSRIEPMINELCNGLAEAHMASLLLLLSRYFIQKFGLLRGTRLLTISLDCASSIFMVLHVPDWDCKQTEACRKIDTSEAINNDDKIGKSYKCAHDHFWTMLSSALEAKTTDPTIIFDNKYSLFFYMIHIVIKSYKIDMKQLADQNTDLVFTTDFNCDDNPKDPVFFRQTTLLIYLKSTGKAANVRLATEKQKIIDEIASYYNEFPQLDIGFCMKLAWSSSIVNWKMTCVGKNQFILSSPLLESVGKVNLSNVKTLKEFYHICTFSPKILENMYISLYDTDKYNNSVIQAVFMRLMLEGNNLSMIIRKEKDSPFNVGIYWGSK